MTKQRESSFQKTWQILYPFLIYFIVHDLAQVLLAFFVNASMGWFGSAYTEFLISNAASVNGILNALSLLIGMAAVFPLAKREWQAAKEKSRGEGNKTNRKAGDYLLLIIFAVSLAMGINFLMTLLGITNTSASYQQVAARQYGVSFWVGIFIYGMISPLAEEIVFRGVIYHRIRRFFGAALSVILCGGLFGVYHGNLVQGIYGCILGVAITYIYQLYADFSAPVLFHAAANISVFIVGYRQEVLTKLMSPFSCMLFLTAAAVSFLWIFKRKGVIIPEAK